MNLPEFRAAAARANLTNQELAKALGISEQAFYNKLSNRSEFKNSEIKCLAACLSLSLNAVNIIFFDGKVN